MYRLMHLTTAVIACVLGMPATAAGGEAPPALLASGVAAGSGERIRGSGRMIEDRRELAGYSAIHLYGPIDVELRTSERELVTVKADDNIVALIETRVLPGERPALEIRPVANASFRTARAPVVVVEFRVISEIVVKGSGDLRADSIVADDFALSMAGSGDVRIGALEAKLAGAVLAGSGDLVVAGRAEQQAFRLAGSGDLSADKLEGRIVKVAIAGSGDASVNATELLEVAIAGSGDVVYRGNPRLQQRIAGSGEVRRAR